MLAVDRSTILQNAQLFASRGQFEAAIAEWKKLTAEASTDGTVYNAIGDLHLKRNAPGDAIVAYLQAAAAFRAEGATLKAIAAYKKVLKVDPSRYEVYRHLGDLNAERGLLSSAVADYLALGKHYLKERKTKEALEIYKKIVSQDPSNLDAQQRVAELCLQENLQEEAVNVYLQLGRERSAQRRYDEARDAYLAVLRIDPHNNEAAQYVQNYTRVADEGAREARPSPTHPVSPAKSAEPASLLAEATRRMEEGQYAGAEAILTQLLTREPGNPQVCQLLARLHLQRGDLQVALNEYRFLAGAAMRAHDFVLAESLINEYLQVEPTCVALLEMLGSLCEQRGDTAAAAIHYGKAIEVLLEHPEPGLPMLSAELYAKVKLLAPASPVIQKFAHVFEPETVPLQPRQAEERADEADKASSQPDSKMSDQGRSLSFSLNDAVAGERIVTEETRGEVVDSDAGSGGFALRGAEPDDVWTTTSKVNLKQDRHFPSAPAMPDTQPAVQAVQEKGMLRSKNRDAEDRLDLLDRVRTLILNRRYVAAETILSQLLAEQPDDWEALRLIGRLLEEKGDGAAAALQYAKALDILLQRPDGDTELLTTELYHKVKALAPASPVVAKLASRFEPIMRDETPAPPPDVSVAVDVQRAAGEPPTSAERPQDMRIEEEEYEIRYTLGVAYKNMGLLEEAIEEFRLSMQGSKWFMDASLMLARCLGEQGQHKAAVAHLEQTLADPRCVGDKTPAVRYELGLLYEAEGLFESALRVYETIPQFQDVPQRIQWIRERDRDDESNADTLAPAKPENRGGRGQPVHAASAPPQQERKKRRISYL
ncbi:MAG TPA: tetratricopeptide repeat protein [Nitrospiraceae bacterium]|nr:tetratricopeptide repeat protein [Nitrospiraceae bacterium]